MHQRNSRWFLFCIVAIVLAWSGIACEQALGQIGGGGVGGGGVGGGNQGGGGNAAGVAGIEIDAKGVLRTKMVADPSGRLARQRIAEARVKLGSDLITPTTLRKVSLNRLEREVARLLESGEEPTSEMLNLAGLTSIDYVFYYPETQDIVIAGPAEGFYENAAGRNVGIESGKATLQLEDLIVALRAFAPSQQGEHQIGCSIDPTAEGLQRMQRFLASLRNIRPSDANRIAAGLRESLGMQNVTVHGVSPKTHFAQVLVEADYRMKLIGIGLERSAVRDVVSYVQLADPRQVAANAMQRWFFTPDYESVRVSEDDYAMELVGNGVKLISEDEMVAANGQRVQSGRVNRASKRFCWNFTENYDKIAESTPVYAQLRNLMDMSIVAAFIQYQDFYGQSDWELGVFADESAFPVENYAAPTQVETAVNVVWKRNMLMTPIGGGVEILAKEALSTNRMKYEDNGEVSKVRDSIQLQLKDGQWWWD